MANINFYRLLTAALVIPSVFTTGCNQTGATGEKASIERVSMSITKGDMVITTEQLSDRIIKQQPDHALYDIRPQPEFDAGHIKTARASSASELISQSDNLPQGKDVLVYSSNGEQAAQLVTLLRLNNINAYYLAGGYNGWQKMMTDSSGDPASSSEAQQLAKQQAVSCWFEGDYLASAGLLPKVPAGSKQTAGYVPPLEPVMPAEEMDDLGLGLGLGLGPDDLPASRGKQKLNIGEGC